ncbi:MAG: PD-(D/E)XK nuclease family transposase [Oscillibacter sp.]|nr:PD-(D/E)XK nuclease family transposase [Oscillibacter sp.]
MDAESQAKPEIAPNPFGVKQEYWERLQGMRLMDDALMRAALDENIEATQCILRVILKKEDLVVTRVKAQVNYKNLYGRSLTIDIDAVDSDGVAYDIEIERSKYRATPKRLRYHAAIRDTQFLKEGEDVEKLPVSYVIFITEKDVRNMGLPLYNVCRKYEETGETFEDDCRFIYVNGAYVGTDEIGKLMADFRETDPSKMHHPELARRVRDLKTSDKGVKTMCKAMEDSYNEGRIETYVRSIRTLMKRHGYTMEEAMDDLEIPAKDREDCKAYIEQNKQVA